MIFDTLFQQNKTIHSPINGPITITKRFGQRALVVDGATQSGGEIAPMWQEVIKKFYQSNKKIDCVLVLGVGGGSVISTIQHYYPQSTITGIEIDPTMIAVANEYFNVHKGKSITIFTADALKWVKRKQIKKYDLIVVDLFIGFDNPPQSRTVQFLKRVKRLLMSDGRILYNAHYKKEDEGDYQHLLNRCRTVFKEVVEVFSYPKNRVLLLKL